MICWISLKYVFLEDTYTNIKVASSCHNLPIMGNKTPKWCLTSQNFSCDMRESDLIDVVVLRT